MKRHFLPQTPASCLPSSHWAVLPPRISGTENRHTLLPMDSPISPSWELSYSLPHSPFVFLYSTVAMTVPLKIFFKKSAARKKVFTSEARASTNAALKSLGRGLCVGRAGAGKIRGSRVSGSANSQDSLHPPLTLPLSPIVPPLPSLTCPEIFGQVLGGGGGGGTSTWEEGQVLGKGTRGKARAPAAVDSEEQKRQSVTPGTDLENRKTHV